MRRLVLMLVCAAMAVGLSACGKEPAWLAEPAEPILTEGNGLEIRITEAKKNSVTYAIRNTSGTPFCYEGHRLGILQKEMNGHWYTLRFDDRLPMTSDFEYEEVPADELVLTIPVRKWYGASLSEGRYRVLAEGYPNFDDLAHARRNGIRAVAAEFAIE